MNTTRLATLVSLGLLLGGSSLSCRRSEIREARQRLLSIAVTPTSPSIALGTEEQFTAMGTYSDASTRDLTSAVVWSSSDTAIHTLSNAPGSNGLATSVSIGSATITATEPVSNTSGSTTLTVTTAVLTSIAVTPTAPAIASGTTEPFTAMGTYSDNSTQDLTSSVTWTSSDEAVATVDNAPGNPGLATSLSPGLATITATHSASSINGSTTLTVTAAVLTAIEVTPSDPSIALGTTGQFTAMGTYSDSSTQDLTSSVTWSSSDGAVATVGNAPGSNGLATSVSVGSTSITATDSASSIAGSTTLTVTAAVLVSLDVTPTDPSIALGTTEPFTAMGTYSDNSTQDLTSSVTWSSSDGGVATISNAPGSNGLATSVSVGTTTITATDSASSIAGSTTLTVTAAVLVSVEVTPTDPSIAVGTTEPFTAMGTYSDNSTQDLTSSVTWSSSDGAVATVSNAPGSNGLASSVSVGVTTITATDPASSIAGSTTLTVTAAVLVSVEVTPTDPSIALGTTEPLTAMGTYSDNSTQDLTSSATWTSTDELVATVSNAPGSSGLATSVSVGTTTITATDPATSISGSTTLTVTAAVLTSIDVTPPDPSIALGTTEQFTAMGTYSDNSTQDLTSSVTWSSSDGAVATVSNAPGSNGLATSVSVGTTTITATDPASSIAGSTTLMVTAAVLVSVEVTPTDPSIALGTTEPFTAMGTYSDNTTQDLTSAVTWSSSDAGVATVSNAPGSHGLATSVSVGSTTITATDPASSIAGSTTLTVTAAVLTSIDVTPADPSIALGTTEQFTATGTYSDNSTQDLTSAVTSSSTDAGVATISNAPGSNGLASSVSVGTTTITATDPATSIAGSTTLTVTAAVLTSIEVTPADPSIALGTTKQFTATGTYSDNSTQDLTSSVTWSSSDGAVATVSNAPGSHGLASSVSVGAITITATDPASSIAGSTTLTVTSAALTAIDVTPTDPSITLGATKQFTATGTYSDNSTQDLTTSVTWSSSDAGVATVSNAPGSNGLATSVSVGSTTITATDPASSIAGATTLTVIPDITFRNASSATAASGVLVLTIPTPAGTLEGDVMIASIAVRPQTAVITPPVSGWTLVRRIDNWNVNQSSLAVYSRVVVAGEPANHAWTISTSTGSAGGIATFYGVDTSSPVDVENGQNTASSLTHSTPSVTTTVARTMLVTAHAFSSSATWTPPGDMTEAFDAASIAVPNSGGISIEGNYVLQAVAGATGTKSAVASNDVDVGNTHILALRQSP